MKRSKSIPAHVTSAFRRRMKRGSTGIWTLFLYKNTEKILIFPWHAKKMTFQKIKLLTLDMKFMMVSHAKNMLPLSIIITSCSVILTRQSITCRESEKHRQSAVHVPAYRVLIMPNKMSLLIVEKLTAISCVHANQ